MRYTIRPRGIEYGGFRVLAAEAGSALQTARDLLDRGVADVEILDSQGASYGPDAFAMWMSGRLLGVEQLRLVQGTCDVLLSAEPRVAELFYDRLFAIAPEARALFPADLADQRRKLSDTLASMMNHLTHPEMFARLTGELGRRHAAYGAEPAHYGAVGQALLAALAELLGPRFTPEVRSAWASLYGEIADGMMRGQTGPGTGQPR